MAAHERRKLPLVLCTACPRSPARHPRWVVREPSMGYPMSVAATSTPIAGPALLHRRSAQDLRCSPRSRNQKGRKRPAHELYVRFTSSTSSTGSAIHWSCGALRAEGGDDCSEAEQFLCVSEICVAVVDDYYRQVVEDLRPFDCDIAAIRFRLSNR